jgi:hypothetical protein
MKMYFGLFAAIVCLLPIANSPLAADENDAKDTAGRKILKGPVSGGFYSNVHIISDSVGVLAYGPTTIMNSVIEAPTCVKSGGHGLSLQSNELNCNLCVEFTGSVLIDNQLISNRCSGRGTNRPDVFGW